MQREFRNHFRNISRIMDCVGCDKCKLWGKVQARRLLHITQVSRAHTHGERETAQTLCVAKQLLHLLVSTGNDILLVTELDVSMVIGYTHCLWLTGAWRWDSTEDTLQSWVAGGKGGDSPSTPPQPQ